MQPQRAVKHVSLRLRAASGSSIPSTEPKDMELRDSPVPMASCFHCTKPGGLHTDKIGVFYHSRPKDGNEGGLE